MPDEAVRRFFRIKGRLKPQFNMRIFELIKLAAGVDAAFDMAFAMRMPEKFKLDKSKKYGSFSFGMAGRRTLSLW